MMHRYLWLQILYAYARFAPLLYMLYSGIRSFESEVAFAIIKFNTAWLAIPILLRSMDECICATTQY